MTIEIRKPELETLIRERMQTGRFSSVEEVLLGACPRIADFDSQIHTFHVARICGWIRHSRYRIRRCRYKAPYEANSTANHAPRLDWVVRWALLSRKQPQDIVGQTNQCPLALHFCLPW